MPKVEDTLSFTGTSNSYATEALARNEALDDGWRQLVDYYGTGMVNSHHKNSERQYAR
jgi:hypothetical protein